MELLETPCAGDGAPIYAAPRFGTEQSRADADQEAKSLLILQSGRYTFRPFNRLATEWQGQAPRGPAAIFALNFRAFRDFGTAIDSEIGCG
jgi:hypothetical protein